MAARHGPHVIKLQDSTRRCSATRLLPPTARSPLRPCSDTTRAGGPRSILLSRCSRTRLRNEIATCRSSTSTTSGSRPLTSCSSSS
ncbi:hypothetical protein GUJ93_ZPchr0008g11550 [Zizania palustris]|uniref:Uncharacterized protein n=1 Tax=Zizania palustris TaxID=103762 RepID=A0A8J5V1I1_ZIZPA|nr:hypothetical protein GUJ93_ZPchr0008g11550 [Zizania palustris]